MTWWPREEVGDSQEAKREVKVFNSESVFETPKQERLIYRILTLATNPGDLVLDSFLGSGTTAAVAHKMGRRWIGIEMGDHCYTHCIPRLQKVIDGTDQGGISKAVNWKGGGGFQFYELAPTLIVKDQYDMEVISDKYDATMLAMAVAKLQGYKYTGGARPYIHGVNNIGNSFIYVTTKYVTEALLIEIAGHFSSEESLLICASGFEVGIKGRFSHIKLKKIPQSVLSKCEYGVDNYSLNVVDLERFEEEDGEWDEYAK
jgi:adenine-specific DNA-methyltransferase